MHVPKDSMWRKILKTFWISGWTKAESFTSVSAVGVLTCIGILVFVICSVCTDESKHNWTEAFRWSTSERTKGVAELMLVQAMHRSGPSVFLWVLLSLKIWMATLTTTYLYVPWDQSDILHILYSAGGPSSLAATIWKWASFYQCGLTTWYCTISPE